MKKSELPRSEPIIGLSEPIRNNLVCKMVYVLCSMYNVHISESHSSLYLQPGKTLEDCEAKLGVQQFKEIFENTLLCSAKNMLIFID